MMPSRTFSPRDISVPVLGLGCSRIGSFNNPLSDAQTMHLLDRALAIGVTLFDTADIYGQGDSERAIGRLLHRRRQDGVVVTKVGNLFSKKMRLMRPLKPILKPLLSRSGFGVSGMSRLRTGEMAVDFSSAHIVAALNASLRRLRMDFVDMLLLHGPSPTLLCDPEIGQTLARLRRDGKAKACGVACDDGATLAMALRLPEVDVVEVTPSLLKSLTPPDRILLSERRIGVLLREVIKENRHLTPAEAVVASAALPGVTSVIAGTISAAHLDQLARSVMTATLPDLEPEADSLGEHALT